MLGMHPASGASCSLSSSFRKQAWMLRQGGPLSRTLSTRAASTETQQPGSGQPSRTYSPLHYNIESFCQKIVPTEAEKRQKQAVVEGLRLCVRRAFPQLKGVEVHVFGSFANGLSTWTSDVDLVVTGMLQPERSTGGYELADRGRVSARLKAIADSLRKANDRHLDMYKTQLIPRARIPLLKLITKTSICIDVSISDDTGPRAARYMAQQSRAFPSMKALVLVLKMYLKSQRLNEVKDGGLSSYSLNNMVIAHLQEELKAGRDVFDLGETLYAFLLRYGEEFDYANDAVSVDSGGVVSKHDLGFAMDSARTAAVAQATYEGASSWSERLCVDCPLTKRDVSNGTYRMDLLRDSFVRAARKLEEMARGRRPNDTSVDYLQALFDVNRLVRRSYRPEVDDGYIKTIPREEELMEFSFPEGENDSMQSEPSGRSGGSRKGGAGARGMGSRGPGTGNRVPRSY
ncbi:MAG: hypothetical protein WDW36_009693 [Sanguina aurantia]